MHCILDQLSDRFWRRIRQFDVAEKATRHGRDFVVGNPAATHMPNIDEQPAVTFVCAGDEFDPGLDVGDV